MPVLFIVGAEMYAGRVACCPMMSHGEYTDGTDGRTPDRYITLSTMDAARVILFGHTELNMNEYLMLKAKTILLRETVDLKLQLTAVALTLR